MPDAIYTDPRRKEPSPVIGCVLGTAVGDALGLPYEGLSPRRAAKLLGPPDRYRFLVGRGMVSDDTEHTCIVAQSLIASGGHVDAFLRDLARRLRWWLLGLPAGIGFATLRAIVRLWIGISPDRSGVFSAGNGPAMRAAVIGAAIDGPDTLRALVRASSRITHTDPRAEAGALAVALAAQMARGTGTVSGREFLQRFRSLAPSEADGLVSLIGDLVDSVENGQTTVAFAESNGLATGVSGYVLHSVPVALHAWLGNQGDFESALRSAIDCGGDTDTTAAMAGGIVGASVGREGIPEEWLDRLLEWPRSVHWMERLGTQLHDCVQSGTAARPIGVPAFAVLPRNVLFLSVVLGHGLRRLLPPY